MILRFEHLSKHPAVFRTMTGLSLSQWGELLGDVLPRHARARRERLLGALPEQKRQRAFGGGQQGALCPTDQVLLAVVWLRQYPTNEVLGYLFGVSDSSVSRLVERTVPLLEAAGRDSMRMPDPGRKHRRHLDTLLHETPELAVLIDTFEQRVQRPHEPGERDGFYSGKKKQHTLKSQVAVDEDTGEVVDVSESVPGPTADLTLLRESGLMSRLPPGVGALGDLAYVGINDLDPDTQGATPRRKPRGKPRPEVDREFNRAFARRRVRVEHTLSRMRRFQALAQMDRHHRWDHTLRVVAIAGLVNRQLRALA